MDHLLLQRAVPGQTNYQSGQQGSLLPEKAGSMFAAFESYDRQARQRLYMISEYEVTIENLESEIKGKIKANSILEIGCDKLEVEAQVAEAQYEKTNNKRALIENKFQILLKEMNEVSEKLARDNERLKHLEVQHKEKLEFLVRVHEEFMSEYMKNPQIASLMDQRRKREDLENQVKERSEYLKTCVEKAHNVFQEHGEDWKAFKQKCVQVAAAFMDLKKKMGIRDELCSDYRKVVGLSSYHQLVSQTGGMTNNPSSLRIFQSSDVISVRPSQNPFLNDRAGFTRRRVGVAIPFPRSSAFRKIDRMLKVSKTDLDSYQRASKAQVFSGTSSPRFNPMSRGIINSAKESAQSFIVPPTPSSQEPSILTPSTDELPPPIIKEPPPTPSIKEPPATPSILDPPTTTSIQEPPPAMPSIKEPSTATTINELPTASTKEPPTPFAFSMSVPTPPPASGIFDFANSLNNDGPQHFDLFSNFFGSTQQSATQQPFSFF